MEKFRFFQQSSRFILVQSTHASNTQDNMWKLFEYGGRISALAEGDRVDELVESALWFLAGVVTCVKCLRGCVVCGRGGDGLGR